MSTNVVQLNDFRPVDVLAIETPDSVFAIPVDLLEQVADGATSAYILPDAVLQLIVSEWLAGQ